ncbi:MAG: HAMP domain-containing protein [Planctomycetota bacterium]|nr:MAG: HAMP domain-containing protein [Planctomycetota bacterium]REK23943.1 MAG: HAMP domain-containing protein [Planctomycetota bacterium]REK38365.1 MAG: HAMP domain-containing protein [Planctomycetota bacterium]
MWTSRLFWKLVAPSAVLCATTLALAIWIVSRTAAAPLANPWVLAAVALVGVPLVVVLAMTMRISSRAVGSIQAIAQAAEAIANDESPPRFGVSAWDDVGDLARSFKRMSARVEARHADLRSSSQRLTTVLDGMVEGVVALNAQHEILFANPAAGRLLGFVVATAHGQPLLEVVRNHTIYEALREFREDDASCRLEVEFGEGDKRVLGINITSLSDEPATRFILVLQDITELRRLESLRQEFVANVSHELKTPLSSIKAYSETLINGAVHDAEHNTTFVQRIEEQADRLNELILDLLSLARIESGQHAFDIDRVALGDVVEACLAEHQAAADSKAIALQTNGAMAELQAQADEEGIRQILDNLIDNALKYTPSGGRITVAGRQENGEVVLEVQDTGIGIAEEHRPRLFERFYRADKARSRELGGTGLGLAIVKHLAHSFHGSVDVASEVGRGSVFTVRLPSAY